MVTIHFSRFCHTERQMHKASSVRPELRAGDKTWDEIDKEGKAALKKRFPNGSIHLIRSLGEFQVHN